MSDLKLKASRRKGARGGRSKKVDPKVSSEQLAETPLFKLLSEETRHKIASRMQRLTFKRDQALFKGAPLDEQFSPVYFVISGDLAIYRYRPDLSGQDVEEVSAYLTVGEAYIQKLHQVSQDGQADPKGTLEVRAMCPVEILAFTYQELNYLLSKSDEFREAFSEMIRLITQRQVTRFDNDFQREIASFFVKERLTFARRVKIKRMDICIECDGCYSACRERHGTDRLGASEVKYGITEIPNNCHNCVVPECIDKCNFGHITRHEHTGEIVISDNCVGCAACSKGCSFNAIQMHPIETLDMDRYFLDRNEDAPDAHKRNKKNPQIAQKCDNCTGYSDQACVTACPTGALFQVDGPELFDHWEQFNVHKNPGFDAVVSPEDSANRARPWWIAFTLLNLIIISYESLTRVWAPSLCFGHLFYQWGLTATDIDFAKGLKAGKAFGHMLGYIGTVCMLLTQLYTVGRKLAPRLGAVQLWFEVHIWFGFLGFIYGFYHTAFSYDEPIAVTTFTLFTITMISGMVGRYLVFHIPRNKAGRDLSLSEIEAQLSGLNQEIEERFQDRREGYTMMLRVDQLQESLAASTEAQATESKSGKSGKSSKGQDEEVHQLGFRRALSEIRSLYQAQRERDAEIENMRAEVEAQALPGEVDELLKLFKRRAQLKQGAQRARWISVALRSYRFIHVTIGQLTFLALLVHILHALKWLPSF